MKSDHFTVIAFYEFKKIKSKFIKYEKQFNNFCNEKNIRGTVILSPEGINGTVAGLDDSINELILFLNKLNFNKTKIKYSYTKIMPFYKLKIKLKKEIVPFANKVKNPGKTGKFIKPKDWNNLIKDDSVLVIDVRNKYETKIGRFKNSIDPKTHNFIEFNNFIKSELSKNKDQNIAMYCTGGIRCEKASAYMLQEGFKNIYQLEGGILKYLEEIDQENTLWEDECFVFDNRVSVKHDLSTGSYELCKGCKNPISSDDKKSEKYEIGVSCPHCFNKRSKDQKHKSRERQKQIELFKEKGHSYAYDILNTNQYKKY